LKYSYSETRLWRANKSFIIVVLSKVGHLLVCKQSKMGVGAPKFSSDIVMSQ
jgi:hypothetical protein